MEKSLLIVVATVVVICTALIVILISNNGMEFFGNETKGWLGSISDNKNPATGKPLEDLYYGKTGTEKP